MNIDYFNYCQGLTMTNEKFDQLFGGPPRKPEAMLEQRHMDLAASIQAVTEEIMLRMGRELHRRTKMKHLVLAGGVALNCVANGRLRREGPFEDVWSGRRGRRARRSAVRVASVVEQPRPPAPRGQPEGQPARAAFQQRPHRALPRRDAGAARALQQRGGTARRSRARDGGGQGGGLVSRADGIRAAGGGRAQHHRLCAQHDDAGDDQLEDQAPRKLPALRCARRRASISV